MQREPIVPEIVDDDASLPRDLLALKNLGILLDRAFPVPGTRRRVGISPIIGLIPGIGDLVTALLSTWIVVGALRHRVPGRHIARMVLNIVADAAIGTIPVIGDLFDFLFQENLSNVETLLRHRDKTRPPRSTARISLIVGAIVLTIVVAIAMTIVLLILALARLLDWLHLALT